MNFDKLFESTLKKHNELPVLDGRREIYTVIISTSSEAANGRGTLLLSDTGGPWRQSQSDAQEWDDDFDDYGAWVTLKTTDFHFALLNLQALFFQHYGIKLSPIVTKDINSMLGHLHGTWKVIDDTGNANALGFGVDVDIDFYQTGGLRSVVKDDTTEEEGSIMDL